MKRLVGWRGIAVQVEGEPAVLDQLDQALPPFFERDGRVVAESTLAEVDGVLTVHLPDDLTVSGPSGPEILRAGASRIELLVAARHVDRSAVHAGVVAWEDRAIVIPGTSMSGKSTLVKALLAQGATYLSDEFALIDTDGAVWPYPRLMTMRTATGTARHQPDGSASPDGPGHQVHLVVDLAYSPQGWSVTVPTPGELVMALVANSLPIRRDPAHALDCLTAAVKGTPGVKGTRGEADDAATRLLDLLR